MNEQDLQRRQQTALAEQVKLRATRIALKKQHSAKKHDVIQRSNELEERESTKKRDASVNSNQTPDEPGNKCSSAQLKSKRAYVKLKNTATREAAARAATVKPSTQPQLPTASSVVVQAGGATKIPLAKDSKLNICVFTGKELHKGLGAGF